MYGIFTPEEFYSMTVAANDIGNIVYRGHGELTNILAKLKGLDDPYYMHIAPATYAALTND